MSHSATSTHIPFLSEDEKVFLNTTATYSQVRRMSHNSVEQHTSTGSSAASFRPCMEENSYRQRRNQVVSASSLSLLWKRRDSSTSTCSSTTAGSIVDQSQNMTSQLVEADYCNQETSPKSPKAKELESLIFEQPQRTVRLSLTPGCAV
ncbi:hypothetical protein BD408DRAFT_412049 [Parasitella parasitica]|nr:hypothetical protein BD408DRAFT_412049 [Parasitella parasitica]